MSPKWNIFSRDVHTNGSAGSAGVTITADTKEDAEHCLDHWVGPRDVDLQRDVPKVPNGKHKGNGNGWSGCWKENK